MREPQQACSLFGVQTNRNRLTCIFSICLRRTRLVVCCRRSKPLTNKLLWLVGGVHAGRTLLHRTKGTEAQILIDIMNYHGLEQLVHFPTREKNKLDLILTSLRGQFQEKIHSPDKLGDHDVVSGTLKVYIPQKKKPRRKVYLYQKWDFESMRKDASDFAKDRYFNG